MPTASRFLLLLLLLALAVPLSLERGSAQATPTAGAVCGPYLTEGTPVATVAATPADIDPASLEFDLLFIEAMIPHHESGVLMAQIALERSERPELREFAGAMAAVQASEVVTMREWRRSWYPDVPALTTEQLVAGMNARLAESPGVGGVAGLEEMDPAHMDEDIAALCTATEEFDLVFIDLMLAHHSSAIVLAQETANRAVQRETRELAMTIAATQQFEVDQLLTWREQWYPDAPIEDHH